MRKDGERWSILLSFSDGAHRSRHTVSSTRIPNRIARGLTTCASPTNSADVVTQAREKVTFLSTRAQKQMLACKPQRMIVRLLDNQSADEIGFLDRRINSDSCERGRVKRGHIFVTQKLFFK